MAERFGKDLRPQAGYEDFLNYALYKRNVAGVQWEWWYHRGGCGEWFKANRNTLTNEVHQTVLPQDERAARVMDQILFQWNGSTVAADSWRHRGLCFVSFRSPHLYL